MQDVLDEPIASSIGKQKTLVLYVSCKIHRIANRLTSVSFLWKTLRLPIETSQVSAFKHSY